MDAETRNQMCFFGKKQTMGGTNIAGEMAARGAGGSRVVRILAVLDAMSTLDLSREGSDDSVSAKYVTSVGGYHVGLDEHWRHKNSVQMDAGTHGGIEIHTRKRRDAETDVNIAENDAQKLEFDIDRGTDVDDGTFGA